MAEPSSQARGQTSQQRIGSANEDRADQQGRARMNLSLDKQLCHRGQQNSYCQQISDGRNAASHEFLSLLSMKEQRERVRVKGLPAFELRGRSR